jgi:5-methylcytosine-specific restriction protein A
MSWEGSTRRARLPQGWDKTQARILRRDRHICWLCGRPGADGVDHVIPGDDHQDPNLRAVHHNVAPYCHRKKSAAEGVAARHRYPRRRPTEPHPGAAT